MTIKAAAALFTDLMFQGRANESVDAVAAQAPELNAILNARDELVQALRGENIRLRDMLRQLGAPIVLIADAPIIPVTVERDECGLWQHPQHPIAIRDPGAIADWFKAAGLTFTINFLIAPEYQNDADRLAPGDFSDWELRVPRGNGWFLWSISEASDGEPIALWVAPVEAE